MATTVKLPILDASVSAKEAMAELVRHQARGAIVRTGTEYRLVSENDIVERIAGHPSAALGDAAHRRVRPEIMIRIEGRFADLQFDSETLPIVSAPLYVCPNLDYQDQKPGNCPFDGQPLERV